MQLEPKVLIILVVVVLGISIMLLVWLRATRRQEANARWEATKQEKQTRQARATLTAHDTPKEQQVQIAQSAQITRTHMEHDLDLERARRAQALLDLSAVQADDQQSDRRDAEAAIARLDDDGGSRG